MMKRDLAAEAEARAPSRRQGPRASWAPRGCYHVASAPLGVQRIQANVAGKAAATGLPTPGTFPGPGAWEQVAPGQGQGPT